MLWLPTWGFTPSLFLWREALIMWLGELLAVALWQLTVSTNIWCRRNTRERTVLCQHVGRFLLWLLVAVDVLSWILCMSLLCYSVKHFYLVFPIQQVSEQMIFILGVLQLPFWTLEVDVLCLATKTCVKSWLSMTWGSRLINGFIWSIKNALLCFEGFRFFLATPAVRLYGW